MEPTEGFNIRWDIFEANTRDALKEFRDEKGFCDVTLACNGKQVSAHKVILAGGSTFFHQVLKQNPHPHPLVYLKGVKYKYLLTVLDFVYTGEVNVNQNELQSFLDVAKDLQIKGLTEKNPFRKASTKQVDTIPSNVSYHDEHSATKKVAPPYGNIRGSQPVREEVPIDTANIKVELDDTIYSTASFGIEKNSEGLSRREGTDLPMTADWCEQGRREKVNSVQKSDKNAQYWYEECEKYEVSMRCDEEGAENHNDQELSTKKKGRKNCSICEKSFERAHSLKGHMLTHTGEKPYQCLICSKRFTQSGSLKEHSRIHTGEKPFQCTAYFKRFTQSGTLSVHKKRCFMKLGE